MSVLKKMEDNGSWRVGASWQLLGSPHRVAAVLGPSLYPAIRIQLQLVRVDQLLQCLAGLVLGHGVGRVFVALDPYYLRDLPSFVRLADTHDIYHQSLLVRCAQLN